jgi:hypothetical protein
MGAAQALRHTLLYLSSFGIRVSSFVWRVAARQPGAREPPCRAAGMMPKHSRRRLHGQIGTVRYARLDFQSVDRCMVGMKICRLIQISGGVLLVMQAHQSSQPDIFISIK